MARDETGWHWAGVGAVQGCGDTEQGWGGGKHQRVGGFDIALEDFIREFLWGRSKRPEPLGFFRSFSLGKFFLFLIYNYNIYEYKFNVCASGACTPGLLESEGNGLKNLFP